MSDIPGRVISIVLAAVIFAAYLNFTDGQPTIPESSLRWSDTCGTKDIVAALELLREEVEDQGMETRILRAELTTLGEHNKQARAVLTRLIDTLYQMVSKMAAHYPCQCEV